ncbi:hypothetical protein [Pseudomonas chlororaphis]
MTIEQQQQMAVAFNGGPMFAQSEDSLGKILSLLCSELRLSARMLDKHLDISLRAVEKQIAKLREEGCLRHTDSAKGGHWEVMQ